MKINNTNSKKIFREIYTVVVFIQNIRVWKIWIVSGYSLRYFNRRHNCWIECNTGWIILFKPFTRSPKKKTVFIKLLKWAKYFIYNKKMLSK